MATDDSSEPGETLSDTIDYQLGQAQTSGEGIDLGESGEFLPWDLEVKTAIKRLAIDIYSSDEAGVRETETNSSATIIEAVNRGFLSAISEGELRFELNISPVDENITNDPDYSGPEQELELIIRDNGMGMPEDTVRHVLRVLGRSLSRDSGDRPGQFGMGFVAIFLLLGWDSAFELHTNPRKEGEEPTSAVINNEGITLDTEGVLQGRLEGDDYGTKIRIIPKEEITEDDLRKWVRKNAEYARVPVTYQETEFDKEGNVTSERTESFGMKQLEADYDEDAPTIVYEDEFIRAVMSPEADGRSILLDVPIRRGYTRNGPLPWSFDIRFKNENQPIVESDDPERKGLFVTERGDYKSMDAKRSQKYTPTVQEDEISMVGVAGTRDTLKNDREFWKQYVFPRLNEEFQKRVHNVLSQLNKPSDVTDLSRKNLVFAKQAVSDAIDEWVNYTFNSSRSKEDYTPSQLIKDLNGEYDVELSEDVARLLVALKRDIWVAVPDQPMDSQPDTAFDDDFGEMEAWEVAESAEGRVFMGVTLNQKKADVVFEDSEENRVVKLESSEDYDVFKKALGWEKLASVTRSTIDEFGISDDLRDEFTNNVGTSADAGPDSKSITLNYRKMKSTRGRGYNKEWRIQRENATARTIWSKFNEYEWGDINSPSFGGHRGCNPRLLVLFPDGDEENISDYYWLGSKDLALAKVSDDVADFLTEGRETIMTFTEYKSKVQSYTLPSSHGEWRLSDETGNIVFHLLADSVADQFRKSEVLNGMPETLREMYDDNRYGWPRDLSEGKIIYIPITKEDLRYARYHLRDGSDAILLMGDKTFQPANKKTNGLNSDAQMYARSALLDLDNAPDDVQEFFNTVEADLSDGGMTVVDALVDYYSDSP